MLAAIAVVEPLPFVPAICTTASFLCGPPSRVSSASNRSLPSLTPCRSRPRMYATDSSKFTGFSIPSPATAAIAHRTRPGVGAMPVTKRSGVQACCTSLAGSRMPAFRWAQRQAWHPTGPWNDAQSDRERPVAWQAGGKIEERPEGADGVVAQHQPDEERQRLAVGVHAAITHGEPLAEPAH